MKFNKVLLFTVLTTIYSQITPIIPDQEDRAHPIFLAAPRVTNEAFMNLGLAQPAPTTAAQVRRVGGNKGTYAPIYSYKDGLQYMTHWVQKDGEWVQVTKPTGKTEAETKQQLAQEEMEDRQAVHSTPSGSSIEGSSLIARADEPIEQAMPDIGIDTDNQHANAFQETAFGEIIDNLKAITDKIDSLEQAVLRIESELSEHRKSE